MNIDWVVAIVVFLVLFSWSMSYYTTVLRPTFLFIPDISEQLLAMIKTTMWTVPVKFTAPNATTDSILYASLAGPIEAINTRVWDGSEYLLCNVTDNKVYWQADLTEGDNYFWIIYINQSQEPNCSEPLNLTTANLTIPWPAQTSYPVSVYKLNQLIGSDYAQLRTRFGTNFRLTVDWLNGTVVSFGPNATGNVRSTQILTITDSGQQLKLTILTW